MTAQWSTNAGKRCSSRLLTRRASACAPTQDDLTPHPVFCLTTQSSAKTGQLILQHVGFF